MSFLVYKSSAGSGKTFTLVKEYLKLALGTESPMVFSKILAITFTNKAASEMTDRILETLEEMGGPKSLMKKRTQDLLAILSNELSESEEVLQNRSRLTFKKIVHNYHDFSVGTIDSFVHRIIRSFSTEMGLNQQFEVELNTDGILKRAVDLMLDKVGVDKVLTQFIMQYVDAKFDDGRTWKIDEDLFDFAKGLLNTHEWYFLDKAKEVTLEDYSKVYGNTKKEVKVYENKLYQVAETAYQLAIDGVELKSYASRGVLVNYFKKILTRDYQPEYGATIKKLMENDSSKWWATKASVQDRDAIDGKREELKQKLSQIEIYRAEHQEKYIFNKLILDNIYRVALLSEIDKYVQQIKKDNDIVLISDFTDLVGEVTRNEPVPFIYEKLGERYQHFLFDEFQDTSLMQWHNMLPLVENSLSQMGTSLVVGDAKQSIYRWRGGVVEQFESLPKVYNPYKDLYVSEREISLTENNKPVPHLDKNFRSNANIVNFNNLFFEETAKKFGGIIESFYQDVKQEVKNEFSEGLVKFTLFNEKTKEEATQDIFNEISELILQLKTEGYQLKDIAILTKTKKHTPALVEFLNSQKINVISSESLLVKNSNSVKLIEATLKYLNQPNELFYKIDVLMKINEVFPKSDFHQVIRYPDDLTDLKFKMVLIGWGIPDLGKEVLTLPLYEMVSAILEGYGLHHIEDNRLAAWMDYVFNLSQKSGVGLFDLLDDWNTQKNKLSIQIPEDVDAVNVLTIHKSKGLDWPVVILADGNWNIKHNQHSIWVNVPEDNPIPVMIVPASESKLKNTVFHTDYLAEYERLLIDNFNAMYVAYTRPAERLYVMVHLPKTGFFGEVYPILTGIEGNPMVNVTMCEVKGKSVIETISYGSMESEKYRKNEEETNDNLIRLSNTKNSLYREKLKVKKNYLRWMTDEGERDYGNLVHKAFSYIDTHDDIQESIDTLIKNGDIQMDESEKMLGVIERVVKHPKVAAYFSSELKVKNESEIILANGEILRPDRVVFDNDKTVVIDFKTGMRKPQHEQQILQYKNQLLQMGYSNVKAILVYTEQVEVVEV